MIVLVVRNRNIYTVYVADKTDAYVSGIIGCSCGRKCEYHTHSKENSAMFHGLLDTPDDKLVCRLDDADTSDLIAYEGEKGFTRIYDIISKYLKEKKNDNIEEIVIDVLEALTNFLEEKHALNSL